MFIIWAIQNGLQDIVSKSKQNNPYNIDNSKQKEGNMSVLITLRVKILDFEGIKKEGDLLLKAQKFWLRFSQGLPVKKSQMTLYAWRIGKYIRFITKVGIYMGLNLSRLLGIFKNGKERTGTSPMKRELNIQSKWIFIIIIYNIDSSFTAGYTIS